MADAVREVSANIHVLDSTERDCLLAWLRAFQHHWAESFERILGDAGHGAIRLLQDSGVDPNRYLKLRRIAIENLSLAL